MFQTKIYVISCSEKTAPKNDSLVFILYPLYFVFHLFDIIILTSLAMFSLLIRCTQVQNEFSVRNTLKAAL